MRREEDQQSHSIAIQLGKTSKKKKGGLYYLVSDDDDDDDDGVFGSFSFFFWQTLKKKLTLLFGCVYEFEKKKGGFFLFLSAILDVSCWSPQLGAIHKKPQIIKQGVAREEKNTLVGSFLGSFLGSWEGKGERGAMHGIENPIHFMCKKSR